METPVPKTTQLPARPTGDTLNCSAIAGESRHSNVRNQLRNEKSAWPHRKTKRDNMNPVNSETCVLHAHVPVLDIGDSATKPTQFSHVFGSGHRHTGYSSVSTRSIPKTSSRESQLSVFFRG